MKFSVRDLLLVTVIVALAVGWWLDRSRLAEAERFQRTKANALEGYFKAVEEFKQADAAHKKAIDRSSNSGEGTVRGFTLLGPPVDLPNSSAPAPNPPKP